MFGTHPEIKDYLEQVDRDVLKYHSRPSFAHHTTSVSVKHSAFLRKPQISNWLKRRHECRRSYNSNTLNWKDRVILTTSRSNSVFCNNALITDVTPLPHPLEYTENYDSRLVQNCALYKGIVVLYDAEGVINMIALNDLVHKGYDIKFSRGMITATFRSTDSNTHSLRFGNRGGVYVLLDMDCADNKTTPELSKTDDSVSMVENPTTVGSLVSHLEEIPVSNSSHGWKTKSSVWI